MNKSNILSLVGILVLSCLVAACNEPQPQKMTSDEAKAVVSKALSGDGYQAPLAQQANAESHS